MPAVSKWESMQAGIPDFLIRSSDPSSLVIAVHQWSGSFCSSSGKDLWFCDTLSLRFQSSSGGWRGCWLRVVIGEGEPRRGESMMMYVTYRVSEPYWTQEKCCCELVLGLLGPQRASLWPQDWAQITFRLEIISDLLLKKLWRGLSNGRISISGDFS